MSQLQKKSYGLNWWTMR